jgi:hypothetical protein
MAQPSSQMSSSDWLADWFWYSHLIEAKEMSALETRTGATAPVMAAV